MSPDKKNDNPQLKNSHSSNSTDNNTTPKLKSPIVEERGLGSSKKPQSPSKDIHKQQDNRVPDETKNPNDLNTTPSIENSKKTIEINREFWNKHPALLTQKKRAKYSLFLDGVKFDANAFKNIENSGWRYTKNDNWMIDDMTLIRTLIEPIMHFAQELHLLTDFIIDFVKIKSMLKII
ncbi:hypothetical protein NW063_04900 [Mycoplasmopsis cynos]|uniref:hypothetical protein n=1 Tax=Mycoplasmopsis cynos TaxID=171284 RepID=UPI0021FCF152|nr:hypothetical protein [Mycoplasmopsis cynos]UWV86123.1 hypothetical protein NW063_04900 [Mycoplasmopsis cynos]